MNCSLLLSSQGLSSLHFATISHDLQRTYLRTKHLSFTILHIYHKAGGSLLRAIFSSHMRRVLLSSHNLLDQLNSPSHNNFQDKPHNIPFGNVILAQHGQIVPHRLNSVGGSAPCKSSAQHNSAPNQLAAHTFSHTQDRIIYARISKMRVEYSDTARENHAQFCAPFW